MKKIKTMNKYAFPVWGTQGGGLVRELDGKFIFVEAPPAFPEITIGSEMHPMWDIIPANQLARVSDYEQAEFDRGVDELFNNLFDMAEKGEIPLATIGDFFPEELKSR